jgi:hypothetical protein
MAAASMDFIDGFARQMRCRIGDYISMYNSRLARLGLSRAKGQKIEGENGADICT